VVLTPGEKRGEINAPRHPQQISLYFLKVVSWLWFFAVSEMVKLVIAARVAA